MSTNSILAADKFQAIGVIRSQLVINKERLEIVIKDQQYPLYYKDVIIYKMLLKTIKKGGNPKEIVVYPKVKHSPEKNTMQQIGFCLLSFRMPEHEILDHELKLDNLEFVFRGVWQFIPVCRIPVVSIYRNKSSYLKEKIDNLDEIDRARELKTTHLPTIWHADISPFKYKMNGNQQNQQDDKYFVQIKAKFLPNRNCFGFKEILEKPTLEIPSFMKYQAKSPGKNRSVVA